MSRPAGLISRSGIETKGRATMGTCESFLVVMVFFLFLIVVWVIGIAIIPIVWGGSLIALGVMGARFYVQRKNRSLDDK